VTMQCACQQLSRLDGNEADAYTSEHPVEDSVDNVQWTVTYHCPVKGRRWLIDSPQSELHGGGPPRLRQLDEGGQPVTWESVDPFR
jgi:hypothetical protein